MESKADASSKSKPYIELSETGHAEERKGLLSGLTTADVNYDEVWYKRSWSPRSIAATAVTVILLLLGALFGPVLIQPGHYSHAISSLQSNGTHHFKKTVLIVSIDGLRAAYLDRGLTPHLLAIAKKGLRAKYMRPIFPTLTFPNHWTLMTGLYAESHGIVANNFWDPALQSEFVYNKDEVATLSQWWFGEPMWETAEKAGLITANLMWLGPAVTLSGSTPTFRVPWRNHVHMSEKHQQIMEWIDLPDEDRPQLIMAYEPSLDQAGHSTGPGSALVNKTLAEVDQFARDIHDSLEARNLTNIVDIIFVSDHGMADVSRSKPVHMDDILSKEDWATVSHRDGWPCMGLRFKSKDDEKRVLVKLQDAAAAHPEQFTVYTHETMPEKYHFKHHERIAPVYVVPQLGWSLTSSKQHDDPNLIGNHGFDNDEESMYAMFVAHGPFSAVTKAIHKAQSRSIVQRALNRPNQGWHSTADDTYVMNGFQNVEVYNLVTKLLGLEHKRAHTNGTVGFWDKYF